MGFTERGDVWATNWRKESKCFGQRKESMQKPQRRGLPGMFEKELNLNKPGE